MKTYLLIYLIGFCLALSACSIQQPLLSDVYAAPAVVQPTSADEPITINYTIGRMAWVTIYLEDAAGQRYELRHEQPRAASPEPYTLRFDGTAPTSDPVLRRRLLPDGTYTAVVRARDAQGVWAEARLPVDVRGGAVPLPAVENLLVFPDQISPDADAINDVAEITYRLPVTATVDITIHTPDGQALPLVTRAEEDAAEQWHIWNGKRSDGAPLPAGVYTVTVQAEDQYSNLVQRQQPVTLTSTDQPEATIVYARIAPEQIMLGDLITVTMRVRNTGTVPIRTYGPPSGYTYTTDEVYSSIADGRYTAQAGGFWRVGMDWDANAGGGPRRYPFRWALSERPPEEWHVPGVEDWFLPGEEIEIIGQVRVVQRETKMGFYVGLIQDGVGFFQDRTARTIVEVGF